MPRMTHLVLFERSLAMRSHAARLSGVRNWNEYLRQTNALYKVLGVSDRAQGEEIKEQYFYLMRLLHPNSASRLPEASSEVYHIVQKAYLTLSNQQRKSEYDRAQNGDFDAKFLLVPVALLLVFWSFDKWQKKRLREGETSGFNDMWHGK